MTEIIKYLHIEDTSNVYIVGDIHGEYDLFVKQLFSMGFNPNVDVVIAVGDLGDRGPQSEKCYSLLQQHWFYSVLGNHEDFCIKGHIDDHVAFYHRMPNNGGEWFYNLSEDTRECLVQRLKSLPVLIELDYKGKKYGFVHADVPVNDWNVLKNKLINNESIDNRSIKDHCIWARNVVYMDEYPVSNIESVFLGHTVQEEVKHVSNCVFLDTGAVFKNTNNKYKLTILKL